MESRRTDICVVGGGPAGATAAVRLAELGHDVLLLEQAESAAPKPAASLTPNCLALLEAVGLAPAVLAVGFPRSHSPLIRWGSPKDGAAQSGETGLHVDRTVFDKVLLDHARSVGVSILRPARAERPARLQDGRWRILVRSPTGADEVICRVWMDASGRQGWSGRSCRLSSANTALYSYWRNENCDGRGRLSAGASEWAWLAPAGQPGIAIGLVVVGPSALSGLDATGVEAFYHNRLLEHFGEAVGRGSCALAPVSACDATTRVASMHAASGCVRVGNASLSVDPLSSQGIQLAIASSVQGAAVANTFLRRPENSDAAISFYCARQEERARQHQAAAAAHYSEVAHMQTGHFWTERAQGPGESVSETMPSRPLSPDTVAALSPAVSFERLPALENDIITTVPALRSHANARPVAFVAGELIVGLLTRATLPSSARTLMQQLGAMTSRVSGPELVEWLWAKRIIVEAQPRREAGDDMVSDRSV